MFGRLKQPRQTDDSTVASYEMPQASYPEMEEPRQRTYPASQDGYLGYHEYVYRKALHRVKRRHIVRQ